MFPREDFHAGKTLTEVAQEPGGITAIFADGTRVAGDLLVGADGVHSTVRSIILPGVEPRYAGYVAWRGILEESDLPPAMHRQVFEHFSFGLPEGELIIALPMPGRDADTRPGHRRYHWVWFRPLDLERGVRDLCTDASGKCHGVSIPPPLIRPEVLEEVKAHAAAVLAPQLAFAVAHTRRLLLQPIFDLDSPRIVVGRAVLLGDAAFAARPHVGAGVTKAALDAAGLADALADGDIDAGLARYDRERCAAGRTLVARGQQLGAHIEAQHKPREQRTAAELAHDPPAVLRDYGAVVISAADMGERVEV
jgi:2-polyprenyl-6-methoxyphenol hydroxylase-like FAD-dependent oxidoreductase